MLKACSSSQEGAASPAGCRHCLACARNVHWVIHTRCKDEDYVWPGGLESPTVFYAMRERQLAYQCRLAQERGVNAWRRPVSSHGCALLQRRGRAPLQVRVPAFMTGLTDQQAPMVLLRELSLPLRQHCDLATQPPAAAAAADMDSSPPACAQHPRPPPLAPQPAQQVAAAGAGSAHPVAQPALQRQTSTPPQRGELPAKWSRPVSPLALPPPPPHAQAACGKPSLALSDSPAVVIEMQPVGSEPELPQAGSSSLASAMAGWLRRTASSLLSPPPSCPSALR